MKINQQGVAPIVLILMFLIAGSIFIVAKNNWLNEPALNLSKSFQRNTYKNSASPSATIKSTPVKVSASPVATNKSSASPTSTTTSNNSANQNSSSNPTQAPGPTATPVSSDPISVNKTSINETISKSSSGRAPGVTITNHLSTSVGFVVNIKSGQSGVGILPISSAILAGSSHSVDSFIDIQKPVGVYTGENIIRYSINNGAYQDGPTISYTITLTE